MKIKEIKSNYPEIYKASKSTFSWILKNKKKLIELFTKEYPKSPYEFVVQFSTERGSLLLTNNNEIKPVNNVAYIPLTTLKRMGM